MHHVSPPAGYEHSDADVRLIALLAAGVALFLLLTPLALSLIYPDAHRLAGVPPDLPQPPQPRLQIDPKADEQRLRAAEQERLNGFGWIDRDRGIVRIPIDRAMELERGRGLAGWPARP
jgi:hypothetical protein